MSRVIDDKTFQSLKWEDVNLEWAANSLKGVKILDAVPVADEPELGCLLLIIRTDGGAVGALSIEVNPDMQDGESMFFLQAANVPSHIKTIDVRPVIPDSIMRQIHSDVDRWVSAIRDVE